MTATLSPEQAQARSLTGDRWRRGLLVAGALVIAAGVTLRLVATSPLWLDEAQTVAIASKPLPQVFDALRVDGSPPLFYLLLHGWMAIFGESTFAVRVLPGLFAIAALPLLYLAARRLGLARSTAVTATLLLASSPFAVAYATEARMYSLVLLLAVLAIIAFERVWHAGAWWQVGLAALVTAALLLTHYWSLFFYALGGVLALVGAIRGSRPARRVVVALALAALPFLPWLPTFVFQTVHTGAPWGPPPGIDTVLLAPLDWTGPGVAGKLLAGAVYVLPVVALVGRWTAGRVELRLAPPIRRLPALLVGLAVGGIVIASVVGAAVGSAYATRYTTPAFPAVLLAMAIGLEVLPPRWRGIGVALLCALGLIGSASYPTAQRTQAARVVAAMHPAPGDVVAFCPDQLGPAVHRLAPDAGRQVVYPTLSSPEMVNWVDYTQRIDDSSPVRFANELLALAGDHTIWYVYATDYGLYGDRCSTVLLRLAAARGVPDQPVTENSGLLEHDSLAVFPARGFRTR